uniref:Uncharacterized protein n=2 Tax=Pseudomonas fluorescens TaxID=294 RepID=A0A1W6C0J8_PSEFL|nr:hypothetical protein [Pseudomonas fluorescens]
MNYTATYKASMGAGKTVYGFEIEVIDLRTEVRSWICIDANSKASAGKKARELGYSVCSMNFL